MPKIPSRTILVISFFLLGILVYSNTFSNPFHFDDISFIAENYAIRNIGNIGALWNYWPTRFTGIFSLALNYKFHQLEVLGYHLVNLFMHIGTSLLVLWFTRLIFLAPAMEAQEISKNKNRITLFISLIFLVHPVQTEAINYIFQRVTILAAFFYLASLCLYIKAALLRQAKKAASNFYYSLSLAAALAGMFSKEVVFTLPLTVSLFHFCFLREKGRADWKYIIPFFVMLPIIPVTILITKPLVFMNVQKFFENPAVNSGSYVFTQFRVLVTYLRLFLFPVEQNLDYDYPLSKSFWEIPALSSFILLLFILIIGIRAFKRYRLASFGILWFFITLLPESSIIPLSDVIYEHRLYLPLTGCSIAAVSSIYYFLGKKRPLIAGIVLVSAIICCSVLSYNRNLVWKSEFSLWNDTVLKSPKKVRPYNERGLAYLDKGDYDKAILDFTQAVSLNPGYADGYYNRGLSYFKKADYDKAILDFSQAIKLNKQIQKAYYNRGLSYYIKKQYDSAVSDFKQVLSITPDFTEVYNFLCSSYSSGGKHKEASDCYARTREIKKNNISRLDELGQAFIAGAKFREAIEVYKKILEIEPNLAVAHNNLAVAYYYDKQYDLATKHIEIAQQLGYEVNPKFLEFIEPHRKR